MNDKMCGLCGAEHEVPIVERALSIEEARFDASRGGQCPQCKAVWLAGGQRAPCQTERLS